MSQISTEKDDNLSVAAASFVQSLEIGAKMNEVVQMFSTQNEEHRKEMAQLKDEFAQMLSTQSEQQNKEMAQYQAQIHSLEQKLKEAEQQAQTEKNKSEGVIQQRRKMDGIGQQAIGSNSNKGKILANPKGIVWDRSKTAASIRISNGGLQLKATGFGRPFPIATEGFAISGEHCRNENFQFPGTILYYFEVTILNGENTYWIGFTDGSEPPASYLGGSPNSYGIMANYYIDHGCWLWGEEHEHELDYPFGSISAGDVFGAGLMLNSKNELAIFFIVNGTILVKQTPINPTVDRLYPTVSAFYGTSLEANFGDNLVAKPFKYDIVNCPGLVFEQN